MSTGSHRAVLAETGMNPIEALDTFKRIRKAIEITARMTKADISFVLGDGVAVTLPQVEKWIAELEEIVAAK